MFINLKGKDNANIKVPLLVLCEIITKMIMTDAQFLNNLTKEGITKKVYILI